MTDVRIPILNAPEVSNFQVKYVYLKYDPQESLDSDKTKRFFEASLVVPRVPSSLPNNSTAFVMGTEEALAEKTGNTSTGRAVLENSNWENRMLNRDTLAVSRELELESENLLDLLEEWQEEKGLRGEPLALFSEESGLTILDGLSLDREGWKAGEMPERWLDNVTGELLPDNEGQFDDENVVPKEPIWKVLSKRDSNEGRVARVGALIQVFRRPLWEKGEWTQEESRLVLRIGNDGATNLKLSAKHGWEYMLKARSVYYLEIYNGSDRRLVPDSAPRFGILALSRPRIRRIKTLLDKRPSPPRDLLARWDYDKRALLLRWNMPVDELGVIKRVQLLKRTTAFEPYRLMREWDWNDNAIEWAREGGETIPIGKRRNEVPYGFVYDPDFEPRVGEIQHYAVAVVTTHGISSTLSNQVTVKWIDAQQGVRNFLLSRSGAPKAYPNLLLEDARSRRSGITNDVLNLEGEGNLKIFFDPEASVVRTLDGESIENYKGSEFLINILDHKTLASRGVLVSTEEFVEPQQTTPTTSRPRRPRGVTVRPARRLPSAS